MKSLRTLTSILLAALLVLASGSTGVESREIHLQHLKGSDGFHRDLGTGRHRPAKGKPKRESKSSVPSSSKGGSLPSKGPKWKQKKVKKKESKRGKKVKKAKKSDYGSGSAAPSTSASTAPTTAQPTVPTAQPIAAAQPVAPTAPTEPPSPEPSEAAPPTAFPSFRNTVPDCISSEETLREAIDIANGPTPASLMLCPGSLTLTSDIDITGKEFTLSCHGAGEPCSVSGGKSTRLFRGGPTSAVFDGVTFEDAVGDQGAAFYIVGGSVVMTNCIFQNNVGILGGAVYVDIDGILQFESGSFLSNTAEEEGGAIYALHGAVRLVESLFQFNQAGSYNGGAMLVDTDATVDVSRVSFLDNSAGWTGGAIAVYDVSEVNLEQDVVFSGNTAGGEGADLYVDSEFVTCEDDSVFFCDGLEGIDGGQNTTDCLETGVGGSSDICPI